MAANSRILHFPWAASAVALSALLAGRVPGWATMLQYDRSEIALGQYWRLLTGQFVHWTGRMALADLGVVLFVGAWIEMRSRRLLLGTVGAAVLLVASGLHLGRSLEIYRGSSGIAVALCTVAMLDLLAARGQRRATRALAAAGLVLLAAKTFWEWWTGAAMAAGPLPAGVHAVPVVHILGGLAGVVVYGARLIARRVCILDGRHRGSLNRSRTPEETR